MGGIGLMTLTGVSGVGFVTGMVLTVQGVGNLFEGLSGVNVTEKAAVYALQQFHVDPRTGERIYHGTELVTGLISANICGANELSIFIKGERQVTDTFRYITPRKEWQFGRLVKVWTYQKVRTEQLSTALQIRYGGKLLLDYEDYGKTLIETIDGTTTEAPPIGGPPEIPIGGWPEIPIGGPPEIPISAPVEGPQQ
jgi:hypothetical protein